MCFTKFVGYTCGHTSAEVLRPCPLTTQFHTNPICATYGRRSILALEMCPACQRILHGRAVLILEWEHHWMHERGVCGCPVIFPDLIKPRVIIPSNPVNPVQTFKSSSPVANNVVEKGRNKNDGNSKGGGPKQTYNRNGRRKGKKKPTAPQDTSQTGGYNKGQSGSDQPVRKQPGTSKQPDVVENSGESQQTGNTTCENRPGAIPPQIHSLYGVEWIEEHRQLHNAGSCKCGADFSFYQTPEVYGIIESSSLEVYSGQEQAVHVASSHSIPDQILEGAGAWVQSSSYSSDPTQASSSESWSRDTQAYQPYQSYEPYFPTGQPSHTHQGAQAGAWSTAQQQPGLPANIGQPARSSGAIHQIDPTQSTNPLYNFACTEGGKQGGRIGRCVDMQNLDYIRAKDAPPPLVGLPIGAGPEAPEYMEHIGSFEDCVLHPRNKRDQSQQASKSQRATEPLETTKLQKAKEFGQIRNGTDSQVAGGLVSATIDSRHSRLTRLAHKKSASASDVRLSWDGHLSTGHAGSDPVHAACSNDGSGQGEDNSG
ncbi:hypothetical protein N0V82_002561 [Gnomoniopsis sp. IMI 355080]|nr:hypothetical protein N0V82_002561 [Gnomoniopsis sp. IMI 355080]